MTFIDSNVFVYALDGSANAKQSRARSIEADAFAVRSAYGISSQVLAEFASVSIRKLKIATPLLLGLLSEMRRISRTAVDDQLVLRAVEIQGIYGIQFYDAQIVAAAERLGCDRILTEDLNDGQEYCSIIAVNPFNQR